MTRQVKNKFFIGIFRVWWLSLRCSDCHRLRQLSWWQNAWDKHTEDFYCAECLGDRVASAEAALAKLEP